MLQQNVQTVAQHKSVIANNHSLVPHAPYILVCVDV